MRIEIMDVTPAQAEEWLQQNTGNRRLKPKMILGLVEDMKNGDWQLNGETIKFAEDGTLIDGQNRLTAVVDSGCTVELTVAFDVPREFQATMDVGAHRTLADVLKINGESNVTQLAAILNRVWMIENKTITRNVRPTISQALRMFENDADRFRDAATISNTTRHRLHMPVRQGPLGACWYVFSKIDAEDCDGFFDALGHGTDLEMGDPIYALRTWIGLRNNEKAKLPAEYFHAVTIKAWNAYRHGTQVQVLRWKPGGVNPEPFPEPV